MQTVNPAKSQLFCKPQEAETTTKSGIILSSSHVDKPKTAEVINIGADVTGYKAHDTIIYKTYSTTEIKLNGEDFFLVAEEDVLGTVIETE